MPIVVPPGGGTITPPDSATSPDGLLKATAFPGGDGVLLEANFHGTDGSPGSPEVINRTNLMTQTGVQGTTVGSLWGTAGITGTLTAVAASGGALGYRRLTLTAAQTSTGGVTVFSTAGSDTAAGETVSAGVVVTCSRTIDVRVYVFYYNGAAGLGSTNTQVTVPANTPTLLRHDNTSAAPAGTTRIQLRIYPVAGTAAGGSLQTGDTLDIRADITAAKAASVPSTFHGGSPAAGGKAYRYTGTPGDSTSQEYTPAVPAVPATPQSQWPYQVTFYRGDQITVRSGDPVIGSGGYATAFDAEAPQGAGSTWYAVGTRRDGTTITSQQVGLLLPELAADTAWIKPLSAPHLAVKVIPIQALPTISRGARSSLADVPGSRFPTGSYDKRKGREWELAFFTPTHADLQAVLEALDQGPVLLQVNPKWGIPDGYYLPGDLSEALIGDDPGRTWAVPLVEVARQATLDAPLFVPGRSYDDTAAIAPTYDQSTALWPQYRDVVQP